MNDKSHLIAIGTLGLFTIGAATLAANGGSHVDMRNTGLQIAADTDRPPDYMNQPNAPRQNPTDEKQMNEKNKSKSKQQQPYPRANGDGGGDDSNAIPNGDSPST